MSQRCGLVTVSVVATVCAPPAGIVIGVAAVAAHWLSGRVQHRRSQRDFAPPAPTIAGSPSSPTPSPGRRRLSASLHRCPSGATCTRPGDIQPHVAINAGAGIPARRTVLGRQPHRQHVRLRPEVQMRRQVERETDVSVRPAAQFLSVEPDGASLTLRRRIRREVSALARVGKCESFAVPARAEDRQRPGMRIQLRIERTFDRPIVRQAHLAPL